MSTRCLAALPVFLGSILNARPLIAQSTVFTDETAYLNAVAAGGYALLVEGFEGTAWDGVRTTIVRGTHTAPSVTSLAIPWSATDAVTTSEGRRTSTHTAIGIVFTIGTLRRRIAGTDPNLRHPEEFLPP